VRGWVCVDNLENSSVNWERSAKLEVYVELDIGMRRAASRRASRRWRLAREVARSRTLRFAGLQAYHGRAQHPAVHG